MTFQRESVCRTLVCKKPIMISEMSMSVKDEQLTFRPKHELRLQRRANPQTRRRQNPVTTTTINQPFNYSRASQLTGGFLATQTFLNCPYLLNAPSISFFEQDEPRFPTYTLHFKSHSRKRGIALLFDERSVRSRRLAGDVNARR